MPDKKISALPPGGAPQAGDRVPIARGGSTQHLDYADLVITGPPGPEGPPGPAGADGPPGTGSAETVTQAAHGFSVGDVLRLSGASYVLAQADDEASAEVVGIVSAVPDADTFTLTSVGHVTGLTGLAAGAVYYLSDATPGAMTATEPTAPGISKPVLVADTTTSGYFTFTMRGIGGGGAAADSSLFPERIVIFPAQHPELYAIRSSVEQVWHNTAPTNAVPFGTIYNDAAGDYIIFPLSARAGTYTVTVYTWRYVGGGSFTLQLASDADPVFQSLTHSPYNASGDQVDTNGATDQHFPVVVCTDLTIPADAEYTLLFLAAGAPSNINLIVLERTGP